MAIDYDEVRRIYRLEKNSSRLVEVPDNFYNELNDFIGKEREEYLESLSEFSHSKTRDFMNLKKIVEEIFSLREKKIMNKALVSSRTREISPEQMPPQEKKLFESLLENLEKHNEILDDFFKGKAAKSQKDLNIVSARILSEIPSFVGTDMKDYGPFSKGQVVSLPYAIAKLLVARELAEIKGDGS